MRPLIATILFILWIASAVSSQAEVHIAILAFHDEARGPADLLTASLTANTNMVLLERSELDKVMRERDLTKGRHADVAQFGKLLHADGLVLLETIGSSNALQLAVRLVAVNTGVVLDAAVYPLPLQDASEWSKQSAARLVRIQPKLLVPRDRAIPISILNLHAAVATSQATEMERTLSTLLYHRLAAEPQIFVLERRQLGRAGFEKALELEDKAFWTGGYLLEGLIDGDGNSSSSVSIKAQLVPPGTEKRISLDFSGPRHNIAKVAEQLADRVLAELKVGSAIASWDATAEAERFEQEGLWALRWQMWPEAYAAAESAWHLGRRSEAVADARIRGLLRQTSPEADFHFDQTRRISFKNRNRQHDPIKGTTWTTNPPQTEDVAYSIEAASAYIGISGMPEGTWKTNVTWTSLGTNTLAVISAVIAHQYHYGWRSDHYHPDLPVLRKAARDLAETLPTGLSKPFLIRLGAFWQETSHDSAETYRKGIETGQFDVERVFLRDEYEPFWVGWSLQDRVKGKAIWADLILDLRCSTNRTVRAQAALLKLHQGFFDDEIARAQQEFLDAVKDETGSRFSTDVSFAVLDTFDTVLSNRCLAPITLRRTRLWNSWRDYDFARAKHYLQTAQVHNVDRAGWPYAEQRFFTQDQAREMIPVVEDYLRRVGGDWMQTVLRRMRSLASKPTDPFEEAVASPVFDPAAFKRVFDIRTVSAEESKRLIGIICTYGNQHGWPEVLVKAYKELQSTTSSATIITSVTAPATHNGTARSTPGRSGSGTLTNPVLNITRQITPLFRDHKGEFLKARISGWMEYNGKIISVGMHPLMGSTWPPPADGAHVIETDPETGDSRMSAPVLETQPYAQIKFAVVNDQFYWIAHSNQLGVLDRSSGATRLHALEIPLADATLIALKNRLFVVSGDFLVELSLNDLKVRLLASKRRKPAASQLDSWPGWSAVPKLWIHDEKTLLANLGGSNVWAWRSDAHDWQEWRYSGDRTGAPWNLSYEPDFHRCLDERVWIDGTREVLLSNDRSKLSAWPIPLDYPLTSGFSLGNRATHSYDGTNLWIFMPPVTPLIQSNSISLAPLADRDLTLIWLHPEWEMPRAIPLRLVGKTERLDFPLELLCTNIGSGLVLYYRSPFFRPVSLPMWLLPWADLQKWVAKHQPDSRNLPRIQPERKRKFDKNGDCLLGREELAAMDSDRAWNEQEKNHFTRRMVLTFDTNADDKLDLSELAQLSKVDWPGLSPGYRTPIRSFMLSRAGPDPEWLLQKFDVNKDNTIDGQEPQKLLEHISNGGMTPAPKTTMHIPDRPIPAIGKSARFDLNKNGIIDPEERHKILPDSMKVMDKNTNGFIEPSEIPTNSVNVRRN